MATIFTPIPSLGLVFFTSARARISPSDVSSNNRMSVPRGGGSGVRMNNPPNPRFSTRETYLWLALCQAENVGFGELKRG